LDVSALCTSETSRVTESKHVSSNGSVYNSKKDMTVVNIPLMRGTVVVAINDRPGTAYYVRKVVCVYIQLTEKLEELK